MSEIINQELLAAFFEDAQDVLEEWERVALTLSPADDVKAYEPILRCAHNLKGSAGMTGLAALQANVHRIEDYLVKIRDLGLGPSEDVISMLLLIEKTLRAWIERIKTEPHFVEDTRELEAKLAAMVGSKSGAQKERSRDQRSAAPTPKDQPNGKGSVFTKGDESLRVSVTKLDHLIQLVGEISLHQSIVDRATREGTLDSVAIRSVIDLKTKLTQDLQDAALSLRMIPVAGLFQKIERVVFEAAHKLNKQVHVKRKGDDVSLDKLVVEGMLDPLIHIARNAVDHGIEPIVERVQAGKNPHGEIFISAENSAAGVTITFRDDGKGIDAEKVFQRAIECGLIGRDENLNDLAKLHLVFLPGLTTAEEVTEYSGRGVGMDVVADTVKKMGGRVEIESQPGKGTHLTVSLPTNLSILDALVVRVNSCQYAVPNQDLAEVIDLRDFDIQSVNGGEGYVIDLRGKIVPVEDMSAFLTNGHSERPTPPPNCPRPGVIVNYRDEPLALEIESVVGQQQIFVRPLTGHLSPISFYGGSTILSDGEPTIILNLPEMARLYFTSH